MDQVIKFLFTLLMMPVNIVIRGYVISWLWLWFIVPIWGWQPLSIGAAIGLSLVSSTLASNSIANRKLTDDEKYGAAEFSLIILFANLFVLGYGWVLHQFL